MSEPLARLRRVSAKSAAKWLLLVALATALGAYMSLGDLVSSVADSGDQTGRFEWISGFGIVGLVAVAGWHAVWLLPVCAQAFAEAYERWFWDKPEGIGEGMDFIGWWPTNVLILMFFAVPAMAVLATLRRVMFRGRAEAAAWHIR